MILRSAPLWRVGCNGAHAKRALFTHLRSAVPDFPRYQIKSPTLLASLTGQRHKSWLGREFETVTSTFEKATLKFTDQVTGAVKPVFVAGSPFRQVFEAGRHVANTVLKGVGSPVQLKLAKTASSNATSSTRAHISTWSGTTLVANRDIQTYVDCILGHPNSIVNNPLIPDVIERRVYMLVVKIILQMVHFACGAIDERKLFGQTVRLVQSRSAAPLERANVTIPPQMIDRIIAQVMLDSGNSAIISHSVDRLLYNNAIRFALRLIVDMASSLRVSTFGLKFTVEVELHPESMLKTETRQPMNVEELERVCEPMVDELLADDDLNIALLPDHLEKQLYHNVFRLLANLAAAAADNAEVDLFGVHVEPDIV